MATVNSKTKNWREQIIDGKKYRYRIELGPKGAYTKPRDEADVDFVDDDLQYDLYATRRQGTVVRTGARLLDNGLYEFTKDGNFLGNGGGGRNYYEGEVGKSNRWRATTLMQEARPSEESIGKQRIVDEERDES